MVVHIFGGLQQIESLICGTISWMNHRPAILGSLDVGGYEREAPADSASRQVFREAQILPFRGTILVCQIFPCTPDPGALCYAGRR